MPSLLEAVETASAHVVLTDIRMPPTLSDEGIQIAMTLRRTHPDVGVIVLSQYVGAELRLGAPRARFTTVAVNILKERVHDRAQLVTAIKTVAAGGSVIDPAIVDVLVDRPSAGERPTAVGPDAA